MGDDRVASIDDRRVVVALEEHAHVDAENVRHVDRAAHAALVRAHDHEVLVIDLQVVCAAEDILDELIGRGDRLEAVHRDRVLYTGIVRIKCNDIRDAELRELLKRVRAVHRLAAVLLDLASLVEIGHDDIDAAGLLAGSGDHALKVCKMVIRGHDVLEAVHFIGDGVVHDIDHDVDVVAADGTADSSLALAGTESRRVSFKNKRVPGVAVVRGIVSQLDALFAPVHKIIVDLFSDGLCAL